MAVAYFGIGSNVGDKRHNLDEAVRRLREESGIKVRKISGFYLTEPVGGPPQDDYLNGVLEIETGLSPEECLDRIKDIEKEMGREPSGKDHPRVIDIDILLFEDWVVESDRLIIPHPEMHRRDFVLRGLNEIAPDAYHPGLRKTIAELQGRDSLDIS